MRIIYSEGILPHGFFLMKGPTYGIGWNGGRDPPVGEWTRWLIGWSNNVNRLNPGKLGFRFIKERLHAA